jgi:hypothetical protein
MTLDDIRKTSDTLHKIGEAGAMIAMVIFGVVTVAVFVGLVFA